MNANEVIEFLNDSAWDAPFFKRLAHNDTGQASGHQGGVVIPIPLRAYFPALNEELVSSTTPTVDRHLVADLFVPGLKLGSAVVRYQFQTWGGKRSAESRLTDNLGPIRNKASGGDLFIVQRSRDKLDSYRIVLVRKSDVAFDAINEFTGDKNWGALFSTQTPISQSEIIAARSLMLAEAEKPFVPIQTDVARVATTRSTIARDTAFRETLLAQYNRRCAISGIALTTLSLVEAEAAHVIPISRGGPDEPRNGFTLTGTLHWAFDRGLFGVGEDRRVLVPEKVRKMTENHWLGQFHGCAITEAECAVLRTANEAFAWHRENLLSQWI